MEATTKFLMLFLLLTIITQMDCFEVYITTKQSPEASCSLSDGEWICHLQSFTGVSEIYKCTEPLAKDGKEVQLLLWKLDSSNGWKIRSCQDLEDTSENIFFVEKNVIANKTLSWIEDRCLLEGAISG